MRLRWIPTYLLVAFAGTVTPVDAQYATPDEAAVSGLASLKQPVKVDPRYGISGAASEELRPQSVTAAIAKLLGNAGIEEFETARKCGPHDPRAGEYPWAHCDLSGASSLVIVGKPEIDGDTAIVNFTVWTHYSAHRVQPVAAAAFEATVVRRAEGWFVLRIEGIAAT